MIDISRIETEWLIPPAPLESDLHAINHYLFQKGMSFTGCPFDEVGAWPVLLDPFDHWHLFGFQFWHNEHRENGKMVGAVGLLHHFGWPETELGWNVRHVFEGKGMAHEATLAAQVRGKSHLSLRRVISFIDPANATSAALAKHPRAEFGKTYCLWEHDCHVCLHPVCEPSQRAIQAETNQ